MPSSMTNANDSKSTPRTRARHPTLHTVTIEKTFTGCVIDLKAIIVPDGIEILPDSSGFRVLSHDLHGLPPDMVMNDSGNTFPDNDRGTRSR